MIPLVISPEVQERIRALIEEARKHPVFMDDLAERLKAPEGKAQHMAQMTRQTVEIPMAYLVTFSYEMAHPCGDCRHLSMSVQREGRVPNEHGLWLVAKEFGFWGTLSDCTIWEEELAGHGVAINIVQPILK